MTLHPVQLPFRIGVRMVDARVARKKTGNYSFFPLKSQGESSFHRNFNTFPECTRYCRPTSLALPQTLSSRTIGTQGAKEFETENTSERS